MSVNWWGKIEVIIILRFNCTKYSTNWYCDICQYFFKIYNIHTFDIRFASEFYTITINVWPARWLRWPQGWMPKSACPLRGLPCSQTWRCRRIHRCPRTFFSFFSVLSMRKQTFLEENQITVIKTRFLSLGQS